MLRFTGPYALTLGKKNNTPEPSKTLIKPIENEGFWAWALGKKNNAMGLLRNLAKALGKQAFSDQAADVTGWAKENNVLEAARNTSRTL